jgi:recombination protein RecT
MANQLTETDPIVALRQRLLDRRDVLKNALTDINPDQFIHALVTSARINPELLGCQFQSIWLACMRACRDNLLPDGREGAIVPYRDKATWIPMYQGLLKRFRASGQCHWITAEVVRKGEPFERWIDQHGEHFRHVPEGDEAMPIEKVYAAAITKDGAFYAAVLSIGEINKIKAMSKTSREDSPWKIWPGEMMKKSALRRLSKLLPAGGDLFTDDSDDDDHGVAVEREQPVQLKTTTEALDRITSRAKTRAEKPKPPADVFPGDVEMKSGAEIDRERGDEFIDQGEYAPSDAEEEPEHGRSQTS